MSGTGGASYGDLLVTSLVVLVGVCIAAFVVVRVLGRFLATGRARGAHLLDVVARVPLEPRRSLYVVEVPGKTLLVGTSEMGLSVLSELDGGEVRARVVERPTFGELVKQAWARRTSVRAAKADGGGAVPRRTEVESVGAARGSEGESIGAVPRGSDVERGAVLRGSDVEHGAVPRRNDVEHGGAVARGSDDDGGGSVPRGSDVERGAVSRGSDVERGAVPRGSVDGGGSVPRGSDGAVGSDVEHGAVPRGSDERGARGSAVDGGSSVPRGSRAEPPAAQPKPDEDA